METMICDLVFLDKVVNDGVKEHSSNSDTTTKKFHKVQTLSKNQSHTDNNNNSLGGIGHTLGHGIRLLESHGRKLIISIKPKSRSNHIIPQRGDGLETFDELPELSSLLPKHEWDAEQKSKDGSDAELISDGSETVFEAFGFHEFLVFISSDCGEDVGEAGGKEGGPGEVQFVYGGEDDSSDDDGEAEPFGFGDGFVVDELGEDGGEGGLGGLDDLSEGDGSGGEGEDGGGVGAHEAERDGEHLDDVVEGDGGFGAGVGGEPEEDSVDSADGELEGGDGHGESGRSSSGLKCQLVGNVVVVVSNIPE
mmetsp:Transcript_7015/g.15252  ORF Transcript_7015/g.15252 Transcript_7015/m.15252 type:complete len:307 (+) Transcript_7015:148-1068(+)